MGETEPTSPKSKNVNSIAKQRERRLVEYFVVVSSIPENDPESNNQNENENEDDTNLTDSISPLKSEDTDSDDEEDEDDDDEDDDDDESSEEDEEEFVDDYDFQPVITSRYPLKDHPGNPLHQSVTCFCHPTGSISLRNDPSMPKIHYFVATGGSGQQLYGTCLTIFEPFVISSKKKKKEGVNEKEVYLPKCLVILSNYPYLIAFREFLSQLYDLTKSNEMTLPVERYITNFCAEIPAPPPGSCEVQTTILNSVIKLWRPPHNQPIPWVSLPFSHLFQCLDLDNIITVWHALALEHQVLLTSTQLSLLTTCSEILLSLLFPMRWSHAYIPVLPHFLVPILSAPMPFLCGIDKLILPAAMLDLSKECIMVDLDKNQVTFGPMTPELPPIPQHHKMALRDKLEEKVGMVFREVRCLKKSDDHRNMGINLPLAVKQTADASWESYLCLIDEGFHRYFTPEESRKNLLNGNDAIAEELSTKYITTKEQLESMRTQSKWDAVQEAFLGTYIYMLRNYRRFLVFPSKKNAGSYGGAGFQSNKFVFTQPFGMQPFLKKLVATQMFDEFITKRLYGSGEADVTFFDQAVIKASNQNHSSPSKGTFSRFRKRFVREPKAEKTTGPLLQSSRVHHKLMTIVPPEASGADLILPKVEDSNPLPFKGAMLTMSYPQDDTMSVGSNSTGTGSMYSFQSEKVQKRNEETNVYGTYTYSYPVFPEKLDPSLYGVARPLPSAVLSEFDRQREDAARFRRRVGDENDSSDLDGSGKSGYAENVPDPQIATFTVFFVAFTGVVGKELIEISDNPRTADRTILSSYKPPPPKPKPAKPAFPVPLVPAAWGHSERWGEEIMDFPSRPNDTTTVSENENGDYNNTPDRTDVETKNVEAVEEAEPEHQETKVGIDLSVALQEENVDTELNENDSPENIESDETDLIVIEAEKSSHQKKDIVESDSTTLPTDDSTNISTISEISDVNGKEINEKENIQCVSTEDEKMLNDSEDNANDGMPPVSKEQSKMDQENKDDPKNETLQLVDIKENDIIEEKKDGPEVNEVRSRFHDALSVLEIEEARETARAQLGLAFEILGILRKRGLKADPASYQCLIDASGRCGDTERATKLLSWMHEDGIVADGVVYSCLVSAFSAENAWRKLTGKNDEELPAWANGATVEMDWNKLKKQSYIDKAMSRIKVAKNIHTSLMDEAKNGKMPLKNNFQWWIQAAKNTVDPSFESNVQTSPTSKSSPKSKVNAKNKFKGVESQQNSDAELAVTKNVLMQIMLGENLLEMIYPDISIDTENEMCPRCNTYLMDDDVVAGWTACDSQDYTTTCPNCKQRFVPHFCVQSTSPSFLGSRGPSSPLFCERLSPWVLLKELRSVMGDKEGIENMLRPEWRAEATKNATLWWNLVLSFMRYRLPFSFLLQGSFQTSLITPIPEPEIL